MIRTVEASWLRDRLGEPGLTLIDPRSRMRYLSGHPPTAISVPARAAFGADGRLRDDDDLAGWLGGLGVAAEGTAVLYADADGQPGALLAWILAYLGHPDVVFLSTRFERWREEGGQLSYRPLTATPVTFMAKPVPELRAGAADILNWASETADLQLIDTRTEEEFSGDKTLGEDPPGHIPGAGNLPHRSFLGDGASLLASPEELTGRLKDLGADLITETIVYCRSGIRASVAWLALRLAGAPVRLY
ncbi:MAG: sulfurtransferase, partial [Acidimicrobiia bacterium]